MQHPEEGIKYVALQMAEQMGLPQAVQRGLINDELEREEDGREGWAVLALNDVQALAIAIDEGKISGIQLEMFWSALEVSGIEDPVLFDAIYQFEDYYVNPDHAPSDKQERQKARQNIASLLRMPERANYLSIYHTQHHGVEGDKVTPATDRFYEIQGRHYSGGEK